LRGLAAVDEVLREPAALDLLERYPRALVAALSGPTFAEGVARGRTAAAGKRGVQRRSATSTRAPTKRTPSRSKRPR